ISASPDSVEPKVRFSSPMPKGYRFVPKGDIYITANVRRRTHAAGSILYVVIDRHEKTLGLRCPISVYEAVLTDSLATAAARAAAVRSRDAVTERIFREAMLKLFPNVPEVEVPKILKHTLRKRSRRVGRSGKIKLEERVRLAVRAHIRHSHTTYDRMLKDGMDREAARRKVFSKIGQIARAWSGQKIRETSQENRCRDPPERVRAEAIGREEGGDWDEDGWVLRSRWIERKNHGKIK
ncbi:hypothetical protein F5883DRAFT_428152, partial [Diaporthe sp. PMI_573]